jgi:hypothetical protein
MKRIFKSALELFRFNGQVFDVGEMEAWGDTCSNGHSQAEDRFSWRAAAHGEKTGDVRTSHSCTRSSIFGMCVCVGGGCVCHGYKAQMQSSCVSALFLVRARIAKVQIIWWPQHLVKHLVCTLFIFFLMTALFQLTS